MKKSRLFFIVPVVVGMLVAGCMPYKKGAPGVYSVSAPFFHNQNFLFDLQTPLDMMRPSRK